MPEVLTRPLLPFFNDRVISFVVPLITNADGANLRSLICLIWAGSIALSFAFVFFVVPESKGLSVDQIDVVRSPSTLALVFALPF